MEKFCAQNKYISENTDVFVGFVGWAAGSFDSTYVLSLTPTGSPGDYTDNKLMKQCILDVFSGEYVPPTTTASIPKSTSTRTHGSSKTSDSSSNEPTTPSQPSRKPADSSASVLSAGAASAFVAGAALFFALF